MAKYFSWKISNKDYAYLYIPGKKNHVSERITDVDTLNTIIKRIGQWDEAKFKKAFESMNDEVNSLFGVTIPYSNSYFHGTANNDMVVMGSSISEKDKIEDLRNEMLDIIDQRFSEIKKYLDDFSKEMIQLNNKRTLDAVKASKEIYNDTVTKLENVKTEVEDRFNRASKQFEDAAKIISLGNKGVDADAIKELFIKTNDNMVKMDELKTNFEKVKIQNDNVFNSVRNIENNVEDRVKKLTNEFTRNTESKINELFIKVNGNTNTIITKADK